MQTVRVNGCDFRCDVRGDGRHQRIIVRVEEAENEKLIRQSGASATVLPSRVGGILMADSVESSHLAHYVMDLITADGRVALVERAPMPEEIGRAPGEVTQSLIVRVVRGGRATLSTWIFDPAAGRFTTTSPPPPRSAQMNVPWQLFSEIRSSGHHTSVKVSQPPVTGTVTEPSTEKPSSPRSPA